MRRLLLLWVLTTLCFPMLASEMTVLSGFVELPRESKVTLIGYADLVSMEETEYRVPLDKSYNFRFEFHLNSPTKMRLKYNGEEFPIFMEPGDKIQVELATGRVKELSFKGKGAKHNTYLQQCKKTFANADNRSVTMEMARKSPKEFKSYIDDWYSKRIAFFNKNKSNFSNDFQKFALADIIYWRAYHLMRFRWEHPLSNNLEAPMSLPVEFHDFFRSVKLNNDEAIHNEHFLYYIDQYMDYLQEGLAITEVPEGAVSIRYALAEKYLKGKSKYYILANELYMLSKRKKPYEIQSTLTAFLNSCPYDEFKTVLKTEQSKMYELSAGKHAPEFTLYNAEGQPVSLVSYRGKVVYLDFWATWCQPCISEMQKTTRLKSHYQNKDVVFLYISLDRNKQSWLDFLKTRNPGGIHLFGEGYLDSNIAKRYQVKALPTFMIIDKKGKIAEVRALRPSEEGIIRQIDKALYGR